MLGKQFQPFPSTTKVKGATGDSQVARYTVKQWQIKHLIFFLDLLARSTKSIFKSAVDIVAGHKLAFGWTIMERDVPANHQPDGSSEH
jgi:hypothetical protein